MHKPDSGDMAPQFTLPTDGGGEFTLSASNDSKIVIFFYPKDDTSGCTAEAIDFTTAKEKFAKLGVQVFGMSPDPVKKHDKFKLKHKIDIYPDSRIKQPENFLAKLFRIDSTIASWHKANHFR